jgi:hypothetical protein
MWLLLRSLVQQQQPWLLRAMATTRRICEIDHRPIDVSYLREHFEELAASSPLGLAWSRRRLIKFIKTEIVALATRLHSASDMTCAASSTLLTHATVQTAMLELRCHVGCESDDVGTNSMRQLLRANYTRA